MQSPQKKRVPADKVVFYAPFIPACAANKIGKTTAYKLKRLGILETFKLGAKTMLVLESLRKLPQRIAANDGGAP